MIDPEKVDLGQLKALFAKRVPAAKREGYVVGRTNLRDCVVTELNCSVAMAEQLIETMVLRGFIRFSGDPTAPVPTGMWLVAQD